MDIDERRSEPWLDLARALVVDHVAVRRRATAPSDDTTGDETPDAAASGVAASGVAASGVAASGDATTGERESSGARVGAERRAEIRRRFRDSLAEPGPIAIIAANAQLPLDAAEVLAVAVGCETDPTLARLIASVAPPHGRLSVGALRDMFVPSEPDAVTRTLGWDGPLRRAGLLDVVTEGAFVDHAVIVHPAVSWAVVGDASIDPDLPVDADDVVDTSAESDPADPGAGGGERTLVVSGGDRMLRRREAAARCEGDRFLAVRAPDTDGGWAAVVRDATITGRGVIVELDGALSTVARRWIERADHLVWALTAAAEPAVAELPRRPWTEVRVIPREVTDHEWRAALGDVERTHRLTHEQLATVARVMPAVGHDLDAAVRRLVSGRMETLAQRIRPTRGWDDIVLSPDRSDLLRSLIDRYRFADQVYDDWGFSATPSRGLVALFSGPSGTGKTLATEIVAGELGLDVFKLDLSSVVSKYIGETEKNLEQIFDAASAGNLVLFFDEADSLFGKRSEVKDARDRYANIEVSYLLQRLERYDGLVVLATNFEKNVDEAFVRRIHARIEFALPGVNERRAIWASNLPAGAPIEGVDVDELAERFELSGGAIKNATVHAAFLAAAADEPITMSTAARGVARELRKMGRLLKAGDFGDHFAAVMAELEVVAGPSSSRGGVVG